MIERATLSRRSAIGIAMAATLLPAVQTVARTPQNNLASATYEVPKGSISLMLYRRRQAVSKARSGNAPVLLLVHGSTFGAVTSYDLVVPGKSDYSMMDVFARQGFDVWALDHDGYGRSGWSGGNSDIDTSLEDLRAVVAKIEKETGQSRFHFYGQSSGALRVGRFAMLHPDRVDHLVLESFTWTGEGAATIEARRRAIDSYRSSPRRPRTRESITSIFTRDHAEAFESGVMEAVLKAELPLGDSVPSGSYLDMATRLPLVDPLKLSCPVMLAHGEYDSIATQDDLLGFFKKVPNPAKSYLSVAGAAHGLVSGRHRGILFRGVSAFLPAVAQA